MNKTGLLVMSMAFFFIMNSNGAESLEVGDKAPEFKAVANDKNIWSLKDYLGKKYIVLYFYPAAMTGGCTKQACAYRDSYSEFENADAIVVGISGDKAENLQFFKEAYDLNFPLLSDPNGDIAEKYGVPVGSGGKITREIEGIEKELERGSTINRWTFAINKEGEIFYKKAEVDVNTDSKEVLTAIKEEQN